ncbi:major facilitator superfamily domain-containing protein [Ditylenchus destructor]|nr:major facilitator superfamily domain-containing protein [Ditylenchus destructor]
MWPFLQTIDRTATERFYGYVIASQQLGELIASPVMGYLSNRIGRIRCLLYINIGMMFAGNFIYFSTELVTPPYRKFLMLISRFLIGLGTSNTSLLQAYVSSASVSEDRSRALSILTTSTALAELLCVTLGYPGWNLFAWNVNMYTAPAYLACLINAIGFLSLYFLFEEHYVGIVHEKHQLLKSNCTSQTLAKCDNVALLICHVTRFTKLLVMSCMEVIGTSFVAIMFSWTSAMVVQKMASAETIMNVICLLTYAIYAVFRLEEILNFRLNCVIGLVAFLAFYLVTYSFPFLPGQVMIYSTSAVNSTDTVGCNIDNFTWCDSLKPINSTLFFFCYIVILSTGFSSTNIALNTLFSKIIGPRRQGTQQGFLQMSGGMGGMIGPVVITSIYTSYGPRMVWNFELCVILVTIFLWILFYRRMTPLKPTLNLPLIQKQKPQHNSYSSFDTMRSDDSSSAESYNTSS